MPTTEAHCQLGHHNEDATRKMAAQVGITITRGAMNTCQACAEAKAKQKNIYKRSEDNPSDKALVKHGRVFMDISSIKDNEDLKVNPRIKHWLMIVDEWTTKKISKFYETKNAFIPRISR